MQLKETPGIITTIVIKALKNLLMLRFVFAPSRLLTLIRIAFDRIYNNVMKGCAVDMQHRSSTLRECVMEMIIILFFFTGGKLVVSRCLPNQTVDYAYFWLYIPLGMCPYVWCWWPGGMKAGPCVPTGPRI